MKNIIHILKLLAEGKSLDEISRLCSISKDAVRSALFSLAFSLSKEDEAENSLLGEMGRIVSYRKKGEDFLTEQNEGPHPSISVMKKQIEEPIRELPIGHENDTSKDIPGLEEISILRKEVKSVKLFTDGAASGNPGHAGIGCVLYDESGLEIAFGWRYIGKATNNIAEYQALLFGMEILQSLLGVRKLECYTDSELMARQMNGIYKIKDKKIQVYASAIFEKMKSFQDVFIKHVPREKNTRADELARIAIAKARKTIALI